MLQKPDKGQLVVQMVQSLPYWWQAWRSGGTPRTVLLLQAGFLVWFLAKGGSQGN